MKKGTVTLKFTKKSAGYSVWMQTESGHESLRTEGRSRVLQQINAGVKAGAEFSHEPTGYQGND